MKSQYILFDNGELEISFWPHPRTWVWGFDRQCSSFGSLIWTLELGPIGILRLTKP